MTPAREVKVPGLRADPEVMSDFVRHEPNTLLSLEQVAVIARVDEAVILAAVRDRKLPSSEQRGERVVRVRDLRRWLARR